MKTPRNSTYYTVVIKDDNGRKMKSYSTFGLNNALTVFRLYDEQIRGKNNWSVVLTKKEHCDEED